MAGAVVSVIEVTDAGDDRIREYLRLTDVALRSRIEPGLGLYIAESMEVIRRAVEAGHRPRSFLMGRRWLTAMDDVLQEAGAGPYGDLPVFVAEEPLLREITGFHLHRGAIAAMQRPPMPDLEAVIGGTGRRVIAILEDLVDHTNVGAIFRSAAALGADGLLVTPRCADPLYRRSVRVSMGTVFQVPWTRLVSWPQALDDVRARGFVIAGLDPDPAGVALADFCAARPERVALVFGTEGAGLEPQTTERVDVRVRIPMALGVDSLNVAAASAVAFWAVNAR